MNSKKDLSVCEPIYFIAGPTASGKTQIAAALAQEIGGEIVSADSLQIFRGMDIGTAKPTREEQLAARHHMIDVADPNEEFSVARYQQMAEDAIRDIRSRGKTAIVAGGSGFYLNALLFATEFTPVEPSTGIRESLGRLAQEKGSEFLHEKLHTMDPDAAAAIHPNNVKRVIRALEYHELTGQKISEHNRQQKSKPTRLGARIFILSPKREALYQRINRRVEDMFRAGLVAEVELLLAKGFSEDLPPLQSLGYKETIHYINRRYSLEEAVTETQNATRHYARRQLTWLRQRCPGFWIELDEFDIPAIIDTIKRENM